MEYERKDIRLESRYPYLYFGDGYIAQIIGMRTNRDMQGKEVIKMSLIPTPELAKRYNISIEQLDEDGIINMEYPVGMITQLSNDPSWTIYFCFLNFLSQDCVGTKNWLGKINADTLKMKDKIIAQLKAEIAYLSEQLYKAKTNIRRYVKEEIVDIAKDMNAQINQQPGFNTSQPTRT